MGPKMESSDQAPLDRLTLDVYAGSRAAEFKLYEDDGLSLDYGKGAMPGPRLPSNRRLVRETTRWWSAPRKASSQGSPSRRYVAQVHGLFKPNSVTVNDAPLAEVELGQSGPGWTWNANSRTTTIRLPAAVACSEQLVVEHPGRRNIRGCNVPPEGFEPPPAGATNQTPDEGPTLCGGGV